MKIKNLEIKTTIHDANIEKDWKRNVMRFDFDHPIQQGENMLVRSKAIMFLDDHDVAIEAILESLHEVGTSDPSQLYKDICKRHEIALDQHLVTLKEDYPFDWTSKSYDEQFKKRH